MQLERLAKRIVKTDIAALLCNFVLNLFFSLIGGVMGRRITIAIC